MGRRCRTACLGCPSSGRVFARRGERRNHKFSLLHVHCKRSAALAKTRTQSPLISVYERRMPLSEFLLLYALDSPVLMRRRRKMSRKMRQEWVKNVFVHRECGEWFHLQKDLSPEGFFNYFRMEKSTFEYIHSKIKDRIERLSNFRDTVSPAERLAVTLRCLATGSSFISLSYSFRISEVTIGRIVHETCQVIWDSLHDEHMPFPSDNQVDNIVSEFWEK
ncbi:unnamed protein product [Acanthoscelides obtectus]|uniref:Transposase Helix-turn-helix domain-containing protein n=1 Tax=Acanthoscelides obtectus TaxID=200917 RepID=A0A9P0LLL6_ACAOB|nr:unnamed protein product [Acanthoscelides obtectus]CAK1681189.1 hypothetical protein AOBTE_LOCUS33053 [Acanthoscelides obtectus]